MVFWKVRKDAFAEARTARRGLPIFLTLLLAGVLFYSFSEGSYFLYTQIFQLVQKQIANYKLSTDLAVLKDFNPIIRSSLGGLLAVLAILYVRFLEGRKLSTMGYHKDGFVRSLLSGVLISLLLLSGMLAILAFSGSFNFFGSPQTDLLTCLLDVLAVFIIGFSFELYFRGFVLSSLGARCHILLAVFLCALLSSAAHAFYWGFNLLSAFNNLLFNFLLGLLVARSGSAWIACWIRTLFLFFCQFAMGISYSGQAFVHTLIPNTVNYSSGTWISSKGIDSGYIFTAVMVIAVLLALLLPKKDPAEEAEQSAPFMQHVPVEKKSVETKPADTPDPETPADAAPAHVLRRPAGLAKPVSEASGSETPAAEKIPIVPAPVEDDEDDWDEEETRTIVHPEFKNPEQYLK